MNWISFAMNQFYYSAQIKWDSIEYGARGNADRLQGALPIGLQTSGFPSYKLNDACMTDRTCFTSLCLL